APLVTEKTRISALYDVALSRSLACEALLQSAEAARMAASSALRVSGGGAGFCAVCSAQAMVMLMAKSAARRRNKERNCDMRMPPGHTMLRTRCLLSAHVSRNHRVFRHRGFYFGPEWAILWAPGTMLISCGDE